MADRASSVPAIRLKAEGTTFRKLLNEVRFEVAGQLLLGTRMGVTEIAGALG